VRHRGPADIQVPLQEAFKLEPLIFSLRQWANRCRSPTAKSREPLALNDRDLASLYLDYHDATPRMDREEVDLHEAGAGSSEVPNRDVVEDHPRIG
jgi:hypothetical protein